MNTEEMVREIAVARSRETEEMIMKQLGDLVKDGLLIVKTETPVLTRDTTVMGKNEFRIQGAVTLELRDKEMLEMWKSRALKAEEKLATLTNALSGRI